MKQNNIKTTFCSDIEDNEKDLKTVQQSENSLWGRATNLFRNQRYQEARKIYEILIRKYPQNLEAKGQYVSIFIRDEETLLKMAEILFIVKLTRAG